MRGSIRKFFILFILILLPAFFLTSCSEDDDIRMPDDILGVWSPSESVFLQFQSDNIVHRLEIEEQDGESIGWWYQDVYYYEPGYNLVIYLTSDHEAKVYQIVELTSDRLTWCFVYQINISDTESITQALGEIINRAQEGFRLDPALFEYFHYVPEDTFLDIMDNIELNYPW